MNRYCLLNSNEARESYWLNDFDCSYSIYRECFNENPKAWWMAMEAIRCKRTYNFRERIGKCVIFSPNYSGNSYQNNLYNQSEYFGYSVNSLGKLTIDEALVMLTRSESLVFHQHWLKELYWSASNIAEGTYAIDYHVGILKAIKSFGAKICWTLHNLVDHDANICQEQLSNYAVREMANVSDSILIHNGIAGEMLSSLCCADYSDKFKLIEHPLYDDILMSADPSLPKEIDKNKLLGKRVFLYLGMIRPYKGVPDLIEAFDLASKKNTEKNTHLIIAGHIGDPAVRSAIDNMDPNTREKVTLVGRRLSEDEMAGLLDMADVSVTPYRKILTSGSFYLATTFRKPTIAPSIGMFKESIVDGQTGFLYDGTLDGLVDRILLVTQMPDEKLKEVGANVWKANEHLTIKNVSSRFFQSL